ncbi:polysaccharide biosynthesis protein [Persicimonas caeni]|uniref:Polysaccharide biosynthesis protein n=1 Tax=Persicimonas caeni TaxID=2292766 RepID=A0A4Y6PUB1_PERCE|nr:nucleoside-diphosphate sugar epimerase/dehydratase [Persicimonas caeni]QDG51699.1 polysaccharide biosynthesis protein [Persicimonas caeni]QED32920.1 polysaccharide biosynthesis protein [Persicimonas caeni]
MRKTADWFLELPGLPRSIRVLLIAAFHLLVFAAAFVGAFAIRFDFDIPIKYQQSMWHLLPVVIGVKLTIFAVLKLFRGWWRYVSMHDVVALARALALAAGALVLVNVFVMTPEVFPRSVYLIDFGLSFLGLGAARGSLRLLREALRSNMAANGDAKRLLILGAGDTGETLVREINKNKNLPFRPVAFLDDDPYKHKLRIHGVPVLGSMNLIEEIVNAHEIEQIIIAMPSAGRDELRKIYERSRNTDAEVKILPALESMLSGEISLTQLREVSISDLLGRDPVELDTQSIGVFLQGRTVLVTGAAGSIGSELCRQVLRFGPQKLVMVDQAETPLFFTERELREEHADKLVPCMADIRDQKRMQAIFSRHKPDVVFHAAAYKHVPLMEANPSEAVRNNVLGTQNIADLAAQASTSAFVLVSTDKAVNPTSVMGTTKRITELYVHALASNCETKFCAVRFGNVLGSNGSVVPIFREQIRQGGPVTVTHPEMTRFFMTIPEAAQLVLQAGAIGKGGELFVLDMGEPVRILDLARDMIRLSGLDFDDIDIVFTGKRPGEKLFEELSFDAEKLGKTRHKKIFIGNHAGARFEEQRPTYLALLEAAERDDDVEVRKLLKRLVPSYSHPQADEKVVSIESGKFKAVGVSK